MCSLEFPDLETNIWQRYKDRGLSVIGVAQGGLVYGDTEARVASFVEAAGATFLVGWDAIGSFHRFPFSGAISPFPLDVVVDREGRIAYLSREYDADALRAAIESLVDP